MDKQLIISVGREFGSGGHEIAEMLSKHFGLKLYDKSLLDVMADEMNVDKESMEKYDEKPRNYWFSRTVKGLSNSNEENLAYMQFDYLKKKADDGESFVIVGRCADSILRYCPNMISIFVLGEWNSKVERIKRLYPDLRANEIDGFIERNDLKRKNYHNHYCRGKWGDSRNYDISVNSSRLGEKLTADMLIAYIEMRYSEMKEETNS